MNYLVRIFSLLILGLTLSACSGKSPETVFPENEVLSCGSGASQNRFIVQWENGNVSVESAPSPEEFRQKFVRDNLALIQHVDHDYRISLRANEGEAEVKGINWGAEEIKAPQVWSQGFEGAGVVVGVIDGMVDTEHNQLAGNIALNSAEIPDNGIDDDDNGFIDDYKGVKLNSEVNNPAENRHGTHVAGIVAADPDFGPVSGVAPKSKILPAQFIDNDGGGSLGLAIVALNYMADRNIKIINMSWGLGSCVEVPSLKNTLQQLSNEGILLITAAGNGDDYGFGVNMDLSPAYPSAYNFAHQINVAASDRAGQLVSFSNYGVRTVHIAAPGAGIYSTTPNNQLETMSGTSMSAPMVSGAAALLWGAVPTATPAQIKQAILSTAQQKTPSPLKVYSGGVLNVNAALAQLKTLTGH